MGSKKGPKRGPPGAPLGNPEKGHFWPFWGPGVVHFTEDLAYFGYMWGMGHGAPRGPPGGPPGGDKKVHIFLGI
jgi:hypothetical protein